MYQFLTNDSLLRPESPQLSREIATFRGTPTAWGMALCAQMESQVESQMEIQMQSQVESQIEPQVESQVKTQMNSQVNCPFRFQVKTQMRCLLQFQMDSQEKSQMEFQLESPVETPLESLLESLPKRPRPIPLRIWRPESIIPLPLPRACSRSAPLDFLPIPPHNPADD